MPDRTPSRWGDLLNLAGAAGLVVSLVLTGGFFWFWIRPLMRAAGTWLLP